VDQTQQSTADVPGSFDHQAGGFFVISRGLDSQRRLGGGVSQIDYAYREQQTGGNRAKRPNKILILRHGLTHQKELTEIISKTYADHRVLMYELI